MKKQSGVFFLQRCGSAFLLFLAVVLCARDIAFCNSTAAMQLPFIENRGQADKSVRYYAHLPEATVFVTSGGMLGYCVTAGSRAQGEQIVIREKFISARSARVQGDNSSPAVINYFKGDKPAEWLKNLPASMMVSLGQVYTGIEVKIKAASTTVEKLFYVQPHARADKITIAVEGIKKLRVNKQGCLELDTGKGMLTFSKPVAFQQTGDRQQSVDIAYVVKGLNYGFKVGSYDTSKELVIDPLLASTFLSSKGPDFPRAITTDSSGNVYVAGQAGASDFPTTPGAYQTTGNNEAFITKFDNNLQTVLVSTFLGGSKGDRINALFLDGAGNVYVGGYTASSDFPVTGSAYDKTFGGTIGDAFVAKLDANLSTLKAATYLGGSGVFYDEVFALALDSSGNVYVAGYTQSTDFPATAGAYDTAYNTGETDAFAAKFNDNLTTLQAATYFGGSDGDWAYAMALDTSGSVYIAGRTYSLDLPTTAGAYDTVYDGGEDVFVAKFDANLASLSASTYLNGSSKSEDFANAMVLDSSGNIYVAGITSSEGFPATLGAYSTTRGGGGPDGFITKLSSNLQTVQASTFLGGDQNDWINGMALDSSGNVIVAGATWAENFPTTADAYQPTQSDNGTYTSAFVSKLDGNLKKLLSSTYLGGHIDDEANAVAIDKDGYVFVCGETDSSNFPTTAGAYATQSEWSADGFVSKFSLPGGAGPSGDCSLSAIAPQSFAARSLAQLKVIRLTGEDFGFGFARVTFTGPQAGGVKSVFAMAMGSRVIMIALIAAGAEPGDYAVAVTRRSRTCSGISLVIE